jgi:hypothetical protein
VSNLRNRITVSTLVTILLAVSALGVTTPAQAEQGPEYNGVFQERDPSSGEYHGLEVAVWSTQAKVHLGFIAGATGSLVVAGGRSPIRFKAGEKMEFIVREASHYGDPALTLQLFALQTKGAMRLLPIFNEGGFMGIGSGRKTAADYAVPFTAMQFGQHFIKVVPAEPLAPGEYCLGATGTENGSCFGVDP